MAADPNCPQCRGTGFAPTAMVGVTTPCECVRGPTGRFPRGQLNEHDEGELQLELSILPDKRIVHLNFGAPVIWFAMSPQQARELAAALIRKADALERGS